MAMLGAPMPAEVVMYRTRFCSYCTLAAELLRRKRVAVREIDVSSDRSTRQWLRETTGSHTVPQIFINGASVGGFDEIDELDRRGTLDQLLSAGPPSAAPAP